MKTLFQYQADVRRFVIVEAVGTDGGKRYTRSRWLRALNLPADFDFKTVRQRGVTVLEAIEVDASTTGHGTAYGKAYQWLLAVLGWHATPHVARSWIFAPLAAVGPASAALMASLTIASAQALGSKIASDVRVDMLAHVGAENLASAEQTLDRFSDVLQDMLPPRHPWQHADHVTLLPALLDLYLHENAPLTAVA